MFPAVAVQEPIQGGWAEEPVSRATIKGSAGYDENWVKRCQTLGNTVVPCVVRAAYLHMTSAFPRWGGIAECFRDLGAPTQPLPRSFPENGLVYKGVMYALPPPLGSEPVHTCEIVIDMPGSAEPIAPCNYPTPRRGITHASTLTERSLRDLPTVLLHTRKAIEEVKGSLGTFDPKTDKVFHVAVPNVNYIEWMMGYPPDWTRVAAKHKPVVMSHVPDKEREAMEEEAGVQEEAPPAPPVQKEKEKPRARLNGLQIYMGDLKAKGKGKDIKSAAEEWKAMSEAEREAYSARARAINSTI